MFEYAITAGEGTLIDYGCKQIGSDPATAPASEDNVYLIRLCPDDCETGK